MQTVKFQVWTVEQTAEACGARLLTLHGPRVDYAVEKVHQHGAFDVYNSRSRHVGMLVEATSECSSISTVGFRRRQG